MSKRKGFFDELVPDNLINQNMQEEEIPPAPEPSSEGKTPRREESETTHTAGRNRKRDAGSNAAQKKPKSAAKSILARSNTSNLTYWDKHNQQNIALPIAVCDRLDRIREKYGVPKQGIILALLETYLDEIEEALENESKK